MPLTDTACRFAKPKEKPFKLSDAGGLHLLVNPNGSKLWRLAYRFEGKQKSLAFGRYPDVSLADARERRDSAKGQLARGFDPSVKRSSGPTTFEAIAGEWYESRCKNWAPNHSGRVWSAITRDLVPEIGHLPVTEIGPVDVLEALRKVEARGAVETAHRTKQYAGSIFRYAIATGRGDRDPTADLRGAIAPPRKVRHHARIEAGEVGDFFVALSNYDGEVQTRLAIEFLMHTAVRTGELIYARKSEFDLSESDPRWRIPGARMKKDRDHHVPLTPSSLTILNRLIYLSANSEYLLPGDRGKPMSNNTMLFALYRMGYKGRATIHGMRGLASTVLNESAKFEPDWIEKQLAHDDDDRVRSAYNAAQYWPNRTEMMQWWSRWLDDKKSTALLLS
jgi:integrase